MFMFETFLNSIPKNRSEIVNDLEIPHIVLPPYIWKEPEERHSESSDSIVPDSVEFDRGTLSTDSDLPLSRAMTDSEIDYDWYKRIKKSRLSDKWEQLKEAMAAFPSDYLTSLYSYRDLYSSDDTLAEYARDRQRRYNEDLKLRLEKLYDEELRVFEPDDPALVALEDAVKDLKIKALDSDYKST